MQYISGGLSVFITIIIVNGLLELLRKPQKAEGCTVALPKRLLAIGIVCTTAFLIPVIILLLNRSSTALILLFTVFSLLGASLIAASMNCRITYDNTSFTVKNFWGQKRTYTYDQITGIHKSTKDIKLYVGKKAVRIDELAVGKNKFLTLAKSQYQKFHRGKSIPTVIPKSDIFKGNIANPGEFLFIYAMIGMVCVGMIIFLTVKFSSETSDELNYASLSFSSYKAEDDNLHLYTADDPAYYLIPSYDELLYVPDSFLARCEKGESFEVAYVSYDTAETPYYGIESIVGKDGTVYLTAEAVHSYYQRNTRFLFCFFGVFGLIWLIMGCAAVYVGRHAKRFSRRFLRLFFKDSYILVSK